jgi:hypothetical protein
MRKLLSGRFTIFTRAQFSEITIPHFLPAGGEKVIEQF